ncbi:serum response factor-binding protein 1 isoform X3 [Syngnathus acus]|uniref:serum response factor-binding protein 1 isoform X3 n=1 Tax=Syngnathus acus TaxID=161584 RepID=UPI00188603EC|nr:serum response factor-binding protein 1 isoform X3 [Syngnathus acus]
MASYIEDKEKEDVEKESDNEDGDNKEEESVTMEAEGETEDAREEDKNGGDSEKEDYNDDDEEDESEQPEVETEKKPDQVKTQPVVLNLNNEVVLMRKEVKRVRALLSRKIIRQIAQLKKKKGTEVAVEKNQKKAARLLEEIHAMKSLQPDLVTKIALQKDLNFNEVCKNPKSTMSDRAVARIACHPQFKKKIEDIRAAVKAFSEQRKKKQVQQKEKNDQVTVAVESPVTVAVQSPGGKPKKVNKWKTVMREKRSKKVKKITKGDDKDTKDQTTSEPDGEKMESTQDAPAVEKKLIVEPNIVQPASVKKSEPKERVTKKPPAQAQEKKPEKITKDDDQDTQDKNTSSEPDEEKMESTQAQEKKPEKITKDDDKDTKDKTTSEPDGDKMESTQDSAPIVEKKLTAEPKIVQPASVKKSEPKEQVKKKPEKITKDDGKDTKDKTTSSEPDLERMESTQDAPDVEKKLTAEPKIVQPASVKKSQPKEQVKKKPPAQTQEKKPEVVSKPTKQEESESDLSDDEGKPYFDDSTEERFRKRSSQEESDNDFFVGKVSKFKKKKSKNTDGDKTEEDFGGKSKTTDKLECELGELESRLKSKAPKFQTVFCSLSETRPGRGGRGKPFRGQGRPTGMGRADFDKNKRFHKEDGDQTRNPRFNRRFDSERPNFRGRGRGDAARQQDRRGPGAVAQQEPQQALHPSWEASKKRKEQQGKIMAFQGKKIKFDDDD